MPVGRWQGTPEIDSSFFPKGNDVRQDLREHQS
jgi:hypothetical protein